MPMIFSVLIIAFFVRQIEFVASVRHVISSGNGYLSWWEYFSVVVRFQNVLRVNDRRALDGLRLM